MPSLKYLFLVIFLFLAQISIAQMSRMEKFNKMVEEAETDSARIELINFKIDYYLQLNLDSAKRIIGENIADSRKAGYTKGVASGYMYYASAQIWEGDYAAAKSYLDTAERIIFNLKDSVYFRKHYNYYGLFYGIQSKYDSSIYFYKRSAEISEALGNKIMLGSDYINLATGYLMQSDFPQALSYQQKALKLTEETNDIKSQANLLVNMGSTYRSLGDTTKAEQHFLRAIEIAEPREYKKETLYAYSNIANLYYMEGHWLKAYNAAMKADTLAQEIGDKSIQAASLSKAALAQAKIKNYTTAESIGKRSIAIADEARQPLTSFQAYTGLGNVYIAQEKYAEALPYFENGIKSFNSADTYDEALAEAYNKLALCFEKTGQYNEALKNYKVYTTMVDSVRQSANIRKATELSMTFEFEKEKALNEAVQAKKDAKAKTNQILLSSGLLLMLILAGGGWVSFRNKTRANNLLKTEKEKVDLTLKELKLTQNQLIQSEKMASLGELTAGIAHEIQNPLNFVNNFAEINQELTMELEEEVAKAGDKKETALILELLTDIKQNTEKINIHGRRADAIVKGMLQHSRNSTGDKEPTDLNKLTDEYLRLAYHGFRAKDKEFNASLDTKFDSNMENVNVVSQDIGRVLLNLLNNAFYAVKEKKLEMPEGYEPTVNIWTEDKSDKIEITIQDNGKGIPKSVINKIFHPFFTTKPTGQGTGLGLSMSYDIVTKMHSGELIVSSEPGEGSRFVVRIPK